MEIFLLIVAVLIALVIIGKLKGDPDIEKLDVAGLKREIWVTQNWINSYHKGGCPPKYQEKFQYKLSRLEQANVQLNKLTLHKTIQNKNEGGVKPEELEQVISPELANDENYQDFLIVDSVRQLTDLALSQGLIQSKEEAIEYWRTFKDRIRNVHLKGNPATLGEVKSAIENELEAVFRYSSSCVKEGMPEELALAKGIVNWYRSGKSSVPVQPIFHKNQAREVESNSKRLQEAFSVHDSGDLIKAAELYLQEAELGDVAAQINLGLMYGHGRGVPQDYVLAYMWTYIVLNTNSNHPYLAKYLNEWAEKMSASQIAEAQELAGKRIANMKSELM